MSNPVAGKRVEVVLIYQSLLRLYGDRGNATVLIKRLAWQYEPVLTVVEPGDPLPDAGHIYLLGGGEMRRRSQPCRRWSRPTEGSTGRSTAAPSFSPSAPATRSPGPELHCRLQRRR